MNLKKQLREDLNEIEDLFPKLTYCTGNDIRALKGDIDICDVNGDYWDTFNILVIIPKKYPFDVPVLIELGKKIKRDDDRHISEEGLCCVDIDHELMYQAKRGFSLVSFIKEKVYPFLSNQLYYDLEGKYANGEYKHHFDGIRQFYAKKLNLSDPKIIVPILELIISNKLPGRNENCPCGKRKYKKCHENQLEFLKSVGKEKIQKDLDEFKKLL